MSGLPSSSPYLPVRRRAVGDIDLLVLPWFEGESHSAFDGLDGAASGEIRR